MDDLDRLYQHLVTTLHADAPHLLRQRFTVGDLAQQLVPYRLHRRALGFDSIQQYDQALLRLVAGERGFLTTEAVVQDAARQALGNAPADAEALRRFADAPAALAPEPLRGLVGDAAPAAAATREPAPPGLSPLSIQVEPRAPEPAPLAAASARATLPAPEVVVPVRPPEPPSVRPDPSQASAMPFPTRPPNPVTGGKCRYCGQPLPEGRPVTFCPYCGQNVTIVRCPACSTELEAGWQFCVTCGRAMDPTPGGSGTGGSGTGGPRDAPPG